MQPGAEPRVSAKAREVAVRAEKRLLHDLVGVGRVLQEPKRDRMQRIDVRANQSLERSIVARLQGCDQLVLAHERLGCADLRAHRARCCLAHLGGISRTSEPLTRTACYPSRSLFLRDRVTGWELVHPRFE